MGLFTMLIFRGWESHYGKSTIDLVERFLVHPALDALCGYPGGLAFILLHRNRKLDSLLVDLRSPLEAWKRDVDGVRSFVPPTIWFSYNMVTSSEKRILPFNATGQRTVAYWCV